MLTTTPRFLLARLREALHWRPAPTDGDGIKSAAITQARFVVVDVETSGLDTRCDRLLSIGAVAVEAGAIRPMESIELVLRQSVESGHDNILLHGISGGQQRAGLPPAEALELFSAFANADPLVAYHAGFDRQFLARAMRKTPGAHQRWEWIDVAWLAPALLDQLIVQRSLDDWCAAYGISHVARHNAVSDAFATAELLLILLARASGKGIRNVGELRDCADDARRLARLEPPLGV